MHLRSNNYFILSLVTMLLLLLAGASRFCLYAQVESGSGGLMLPDASSKEMVKSLILVDEPAQQALSVLEQLTEKRILLDQNLPKVQINFNSRGPIAKEDAILALESALSMNGTAVVDMGEFLKAVPIEKVKSEAPKLIEDTSFKLKPSQKVYSKIFHLKYIPINEAVFAIKKITTKELETPVLLRKSNALLVTDTLVNIQRVEKLLSDVDRPSALTEKIAFYHLQYANAEDILKRLNTLKSGGAKKYLDDVTFDADKETNQILVFAHPNRLPLIETVISNLDKNVEASSKSEVFKLLHAKAKEVTQIIKNLVKPASVASSNKKPTSSNSAKTPRERLLERLRGAAGNQSETSSEAQEIADRFSETLTVEADERSNAVIAFGTKRDIELVRDLIKEIDVLLPQVRIEVLIAEVTLGHDRVSGLEAFGIEHRTTPSATTSTPGKSRLKGVATPLTKNITQSALGLVGSLNTFSFDFVLRKAQEDRTISILSTPTIMTSHNRKGKIVVGERRPVITSTTTDVSNASTRRSTTDYINIALELEVTPLIGKDGIVELEIKQIVKDRIDDVQTTGGEVLQTLPVISNREASSFVSVKDGEMIVLGGLQSVKKTKAKGRTFLLGWVPIIGELISPKKWEDTRSELIFFIKPNVVMHPNETQAHTQKTIENYPESEKIITYAQTGFLEPKEASCCCPEVARGKTKQKSRRHWKSVRGRRK